MVNLQRDPVASTIVEKLMPIHTAQVLTYLRLTEARQALLFNFNGITLMEGFKSFLGSRNAGSH